MYYRIEKNTPAGSRYLAPRFETMRQAKDALKTLWINYGGEGDYMPYLFDRNRALCAFDGGDRHLFYIHVFDHHQN